MSETRTKRVRNGSRGCHAQEGSAHTFKGSLHGLPSLSGWVICSKTHVPKVCNNPAARPKPAAYVSPGLLLYHPQKSACDSMLLLLDSHHASKCMMTWPGIMKHKPDISHSSCHRQKPGRAGHFHGAGMLSMCLCAEQDRGSIDAACPIENIDFCRLRQGPQQASPESSYHLGQEGFRLSDDQDVASSQQQHEILARHSKSLLIVQDKTTIACNCLLSEHQDKHAPS